MSDEKKWKKLFGAFLKLTCDGFVIDVEDIADEKGYDITTIRKWMSGSRFPGKTAQKFLLEFLPKRVSGKIIAQDFRSFANNVEGIFSEFGLQHIQRFELESQEDFQVFVTKILLYCFGSFRENRTRFKAQAVLPTEKQKTRAIVFDFDGTLTTCKANRTTWEDIWTSLNYDVEMCRKYHKQFDRKEITHKEWCKITEDYFKQGGMNLQILKEIASKITLMPGIEEFLKEMNAHDIKMYIVSGSIFHVIRYALGPLYSYFDGIKANQFFFNEDNSLREIVGTSYDFEGKAEYIRQLSQELRISPSSILFVGNSINDEYAHASGARTLCINPKYTDSSNKTIWHDCLKSCSDMNEIRPYIIL